MHYTEVDSPPYSGLLHFLQSAQLRFEMYSTQNPTLQRRNTEISKQIFPEKEYRGLSPNFHIHGTVSDLYIPTIGLPIVCWRKYVD